MQIATVEHRRERIRREMIAALDANPDLTEYGIGLYEDYPRRRSPAEHQAALTTEHRELSDLVERDFTTFVHAVDWLYRQPRRASVNRDVGSSYGLKHVFSAQTGIYISNGRFILAALVAGVKITRKPHSPRHAMRMTTGWCDIGWRWRCCRR